MSELVLRDAWQKRDPVVERDAELFWRTWKLLPEQGDEVTDRLGQLCAAAYRGTELVGLSTATIRNVISLRCKLAMYRTAVSPSCRYQQVATQLGRFSRELLEAWSREHPEESVMGLGAVIQSRTLVEHMPYGVYPGTKLGFIGYTQEGYQMRVYWFAHARISTYWPGDPDGAGKAMNRSLPNGSE